MSNEHNACVHTVVHESMERVWKALVEPQDSAQYRMGAQVITDRKQGGPIRWKGEWKGKVFEDTGRVLKVREGELLSYTHEYTTAEGTTEVHTVTFELKEVGGVTHLRVTQENNSTVEAKEQAEANWKQLLDQLKEHLGEAPVDASIERK